LVLRPLQLMGRHSRMVDLLVRKQVVFGWFANATTVEAARRAAKDPLMDFVFINMESTGAYDPAAVRGFMQAMLEAGLQTNPNTHPIVVRIPTFHGNPVSARRRIAELLNLGVHGIVCPEVESADETTQAIAAMRFAKTAVASKSPSPAGTRVDDVGESIHYWGMSEEEYRMRADVYPLNPVGELASLFIVESEKGVAASREIARTRPTIICPGPGTLRSVLQVDAARVDAAIQTVLAACKEFDVPCGIPANATDVEKRIKEGFRAIILDDRDYEATIKIGRAAAGRR
jgi:2-keto-3-deoxy-L-rhamnonate aldolase RhmA